jgi:hypothetical protein
MKTEELPTGIETIVLGSWWSTAWTRIHDFFQKYIIAIIIFGALTAAVIVYWITEDWSIASSIAATGVGAALFKAFVFSGIFRKEAMKGFEEIVNSTDFELKIGRAVAGGTIPLFNTLTNDELYKLWSEASRHLCKKKFSNISSELSELIKTKYLPINSRYYCSDLDFEIHIEKFEDGYLETQEIFKGEFHSDSHDEFPIPAMAYYDFIDKDDTGWLEVSSIIYGGTSRDHEKFPPLHKVSFDKENIKLEVDQVKKRKTWSTENLVKGFSDYYVVRVVKKRYPFKRNETKSYTFSAISNKITVVLFMTAEISTKLQVDHFPLGSDAFFIDPHEIVARRGGHVCIKNVGLLLPSQGFLFHFKEN